LAKKGGLTETDISAMKSLYDTLDEFHQNLKKQAAAADKKDTLIVRRYFEKFLRKTSSDLASLDTRIRRGEMALFSKDTKAIAAAGDEVEEEEEVAS
jgi:hypothetical protein